MASQEQLRLSAAVLAAGFLRLADGYHPYGNPNASGDPHGMIAQAEHHLGPLGQNHLAVVKQHLQRANAAAAGGDHTTAEMHYRDAARRIQTTLGAGHPLHYSVQSMIAHHNAMAHGQMGLRDRPGAGAGAGLPSDVQHALGKYDAGHRLPSGPAHQSLAQHIDRHTPSYGRRR